MSGILIGVGVGPGDPELITVAGMKAIESADVIVVPSHGEGRFSIVLTVIAPYLTGKTMLAGLDCPMTTDEEKVIAAWKSNAEDVKGLLESGKKVVFPTLGDPMFYSTFVYLKESLQKSNFRVRSIPGVPAFLGAASLMRRPVGMKVESVHIIMGTSSEEEINRQLENTDNAVIMKVYDDFRKVRNALKRNHMLKNAVMVSSMGLPSEKIIYHLENLPDDYEPMYLTTILTSRDK